MFWLGFFLRSVIGKYFSRRLSSRKKFSTSRNKHFILPQLKTVCKTTLCAEITLQDNSYTQLVQKGVAKMKHRPDLRSNATSFRSVGHFCESLFGLILFIKLFSQSYFWYQLIFCKIFLFPTFG